jgi:hypothetical protein
VLGHSYYGDKVLFGHDQFKYEKKYAWWPTRSGSNKRIWLKPYYIQHTYYDDNGKPPIKGLSWEYIYTLNEFLILQIKGA